MMDNYNDFTSDDELHITTGESTSIIDIAGIIQNLFELNGKVVDVSPAESKDEVQKDARNEPDPYIKKWWQPKTTVSDGIGRVFDSMKINYE
jgi:nucleoside-diphosphate-sugar epimerase